MTKGAIMTAKRKSATITWQAAFCLMLMEKLHGNIAGREKLLKGGLEQQRTKTAIKREITELRAALLELSKMVEKDI